MNCPPPPVCKSEFDSINIFIIFLDKTKIVPSGNEVALPALQILYLRILLLS